MPSVTVHDIANDIEARNVAFKHYVSFRDIYLDKNHKLYDELWDNLDKYPLFLISYEDNKPVGMAGVNDFYWKQDGVARVMDRAFNFERTLSSFGRTSKYILHTTHFMIHTAYDRRFPTYYLLVTACRIEHAI